VALMAAALIADFCASAVNREGVYHMLSKRFLWKYSSKVRSGR
jgi:hypothetical protein